MSLRSLLPIHVVASSLLLLTPVLPGVHARGLSPLMQQTCVAGCAPALNNPATTFVKQFANARTVAEQFDFQRQAPGGSNYNMLAPMHAPSTHQPVPLGDDLRTQLEKHIQSSGPSQTELGSSLSGENSPPSLEEARHSPAVKTLQEVWEEVQAAPKGPSKVQAAPVRVVSPSSFLGQERRPKVQAQRRLSTLVGHVFTSTPARPSLKLEKAEVLSEATGSTFDPNSPLALRSISSRSNSPPPAPVLKPMAAPPLGDWEDLDAMGDLEDFEMLPPSLEEVLARASLSRL